jgi:tetratricopeptide (TPR) repeat protein
MLIRASNAAAHSGNLQQAQETAREAAAKAQSTLHKPSLAAACYTLASHLWSDEGASAVEARNCAETARDSALPNSEEYLLSTTLLARIETAIGNLDAAKNLLSELLARYEQKERAAGIADIYRSMGDLALKQRDSASAKQYFQASLTLYDNKVNDPLNQAGLLLSMGILAYQERDFAQARNVWERARDIGHANSLPQIKNLALQNLEVLAEAIDAHE